MKATLSWRAMLQVREAYHGVIQDGQWTVGPLGRFGLHANCLRMRSRVSTLLALALHVGSACGALRQVLHVARRPAFPNPQLPARP